MTVLTHTFLNGSGELSLFDVLNLAHCAAKRANMAACEPGNRFTREYDSALAWTVAASAYDMKFHYNNR